jgi:hypothetical protein
MTNTSPESSPDHDNRRSLHQTLLVKLSGKLYQLRTAVNVDIVETATDFIAGTISKLLPSQTVRLPLHED